MSSNGGAGRDAAVGVALGGVVDEPARGADPLLCADCLSLGLAQRGRSLPSRRRAAAASSWPPATLASTRPPRREDAISAARRLVARGVRMRGGQKRRRSRDVGGGEGGAGAAGEAPAEVAREDLVARRGDVDAGAPVRRAARERPARLADATVITDGERSEAG